MAKDIEMVEEAEEVEVAEVEVPAEESQEDNAQSEEHHQKPELSDEDYSRAVRKRINKEIAKRKAAEDSFNSAREQAEAAAKRAAELEERLDAIEETRIKQIKLEKQELLREAIADGDTEAQNTLMGEVLDLFAQEKEFSKRRGQKEAPAPVADSPPPQPTTHPAAAAFMDRNDWFHANAKAADRAMEIEKELKAEGYEFGDDLYEELEARIYKELPELDDLHPNAVVVKDTEKRQPVPPLGRGGGRPPKRESGNHMSKDAQATMRRYGLDPNNADDIKGFLKHHRGA